MESLAQWFDNHRMGRPIDLCAVCLGSNDRIAPGAGMPGGRLRRFRFILSLGLGWAVLALGGNRASADVIASDSFAAGTGDYTSSTTAANLFGQTSASATGFSGSWAGGSTGAIDTKNGTNLSFAGISNPGTAKLLFNSVNNGNSSHDDYRSFTSTLGNSALWFGTLINADANTLNASLGFSAMVGFLSGSLGVTSSTASSSAAQWNSSNGGSLGGFAWGISSGSLSVAYQSAASTGGAVTIQSLGYSLTAGTTYLLLGQLIVNSADSDTLNIWVEAAAPASQGALGTPTFSITGDLLTASQGINTLNIYNGASTGAGVTANMSVDSIAVATTFNDIVPVPEPAAAAMIPLAGALGLLAMGWRRIQRRQAPLHSA